MSPAEGLTEPTQSPGKPAPEGAAVRATSVEKRGTRSVELAGGGDKPPLRRSLSEGLRIGGRIVVFALVVLVVYALVREFSYVLFAPELEVLAQVPPGGALAPGQPVTLGVRVRNRGRMDGASFLVAALGDGVEVEGPTVEVAARDTALVPVEITLGPGENVLSLVVFDGWRGVRRIETLRGLTIRTGTVDITAGEVSMPGRATRGDSLVVTFPWTNTGMVKATVVPVAVFRPVRGGPPVAAEGEPVAVASGETRTIELTVDTWPLRSGTYSSDILVTSESGDRIGQTRSRLTLEVVEP